MVFHRAPATLQTSLIIEANRAAGIFGSLELPAVPLAKITARIVFIVSSVEGLQLRSESYRR